MSQKLSTVPALGLAVVTALAVPDRAHAAPTYATWLGGGQSIDQAYGAATGPAGDVYVAGRTVSPDFPFTPGGPIAPSFAFQSQPFVARIAPGVPGLGGLVFADFLGGTAGDGGGEARAVAVDGAGNVYVVGVHSSWTIPVVGGFAQHPADHNNAFLVKLAPDGHTILYSTYIGGSANVDELDEIVVDDAGIATVAGRTASHDFPVKAGYAGPPTNGLFDAVVMRIDTTKTGAASLLWSTCYGSLGSDAARSVAVGPGGLVYLTGTTSSFWPTYPLPTSANAFKFTHGGGDDAFVAVIDPTIPGADALVYATYLGGAYTEEGGAIGVDAAGHAYATGATLSPTFPTTAGVHDTTVDQTFGAGTRSDAFLVKIDPFAPVAAETLVWSTVIGGAQNEYGWDLEVDGQGRPIIGGQTGSLDFPASDCSLPRDAATTAFVARFTTTGQLEDAQVFGGITNERTDGVALLPGGHLVIAGTSGSPSLPVTADAVQPNRPGGGDDVFVAVLWDCTTCPPGATLAGVVCAPCPAGTASPDGGECRACPDGTVAPDQGSAACAACAPGSQPDPTQTACEPCAAGTYSADGAACLACPPGTSAGAGATACAVACTPGQLLALESPGLTPVFEPALGSYHIPAPASSSTWVKATLCDPSRKLYVGGNQVASGSLVGAWTGGGAVSVSIYAGWTQVGQYTLAVDAALPPAPLADGLAGLVTPGLTPAFAPATTAYTAPAQPGWVTPVTATASNPLYTLYVDGTQVTSGATFNTWAPPGSTIDVSVYWGWIPIGDYDVAVTP